MSRSASHLKLLVDIGSSSVGGALMTEHKSGVPELSHVTRVPLTTAEGARPLTDALGTSLATLFKEYAPLIHHGTAHVVLAAPWHHAKIRTVQSASDKPHHITEKSIEQAILTYKNEAPPEAGRSDLEAVAVQVRVNGYPTSLRSPVTGTSLRINLYESEVDTATLSVIQQTLAHELPDVRASFHSFPLVAGTALRIASPENNFLFADVGGKITDFAVVHADGIHFLASFPVGFETVLLDMKAPDAAARLALFARNELSPEEAATVQEKFSAAFKPWLDACEQALTAGATAVPIPRTFFVMSSEETLPWIARGITSFGALNLSPTPIEPSFMQRFVAVGEEGRYDVFLALAAMFFHTGVAEVVGENTPISLKV